MTASTDAFQRGAFYLRQPKFGGHRAGMDALVLAAAAPAGFAGRAADLGSGAGAAGLALIARCPLASVTLVEAEPAMADFARQSLLLPENAALAKRADVLETDVTLSGAAREAAGLAASSFDFVISNPPFNAPADRQAKGALKRKAHVLEPGALGQWVKTAAAIARPRGQLAMILRPVLLPEMLGALAGRFGAIQIQPIHARSEEAAIRIVIRAAKGSRAALEMLPGLVLHAGSGQDFTAEAAAVFDGKAALFSN